MIRGRGPGGEMLCPHSFLSLPSSGLDPRKLVGLHRNVNAAFLLGREFDVALAKRKQSVVGAHAHAIARMPLGTALPHDDVSRDHALAARLLDAEPPAGGVAAVTG